MLTVFLATHAVPDPGFLTRLVRAGAEAGLVGGIADWFAVTALFRHPLGLPIPHTAIIPNNQERIGRALARFVQRHFLTEEVLLRKLREGRFRERLVAWMASPDTAAAVVGPAAAGAAEVLRSLRNRDLQALANRTLGEHLRRAQLAPLLGRAVRLLTQSGEADVLFDRAIDAASDWLSANRSQIDRLVAERSRWWVPRTVDQRVADAILRDVNEILRDLREPGSEARLRFRAALDELADELVNSPKRRARVEAAKHRLLDHPEVQAWLTSIWQELSDRTLAELDRPGSRTREGLARGLTILGQALATDPAMQAHIDALLKRLAGLLVSWRGEIGGFIADVVRSWDIHTLTERLELTVASDLQYIRMNGTVVGACIGCVIFVFSWLVFPEAPAAGH